MYMPTIINIPSTGPEKTPRYRDPIQEEYEHHVRFLEALRQLTSMVFFPCGEIEIRQCGDLGGKSPPRAAKIKRLSNDYGFELLSRDKLVFWCRMIMTNSGVYCVTAWVRIVRMEKLEKIFYRPWSNISPNGPAIPVLRACFLRVELVAAKTR